MDYTRGSDITSALKYMYQNKYGISTEILAECRNIHDVVYAAELSQVTDASPDFSDSSITETFNLIGDYYKELSGGSDTPDEPVTSDNPDTPDEPVTPDTPDTPDEPVTPDDQQEGTT